MHKIVGNRIYIRLLTVMDVTDKYVNWLNDKEVNKYLECRFSEHDLNSVKDFVKEMCKDTKNFLFGIFLRHDSSHIGNIKLGDVNLIHRFGTIGLLIGEKQHWNKGYGTETIKLLTKFAFEQLKLRKLLAGMYEENLGSLHAFINNGFRVIGRMKDHWKLDNKFNDEILVEKLNE